MYQQVDGVRCLGRLVGAAVVQAQSEMNEDGSADGIDFDEWLEWLDKEREGPGNLHVRDHGNPQPILMLPVLLILILLFPIETKCMGVRRSRV